MEWYLALLTCHLVLLCYLLSFLSPSLHSSKPLFLFPISLRQSPTLTDWRLRVPWCLLWLVLLFQKLLWLLEDVMEATAMLWSVCKFIILICIKDCLSRLKSFWTLFFSVEGLLTLTSCSCGLMQECQFWPQATQRHLCRLKRKSHRLMRCKSQCNRMPITGCFKCV